LGGAVCSRGFMLLTQIVVARVVGKAGFGEWSLAINTAGAFGVLASFGLGLTASKHIAEFRNTDPNRAGGVLSLVLLAGMTTVLAMAATCFVASEWLAVSFYRVPEAVVLLRLGSVLVFGLVSIVLLESILAGFEDFRAIAGTNIVQGIVLFIAGCLLAPQFGLTGAISAVAISQIAALSLAFRAMLANCRRHRIRLSPQSGWHERRVLLTYALPSVIADAISAVAVTASQAIVVRVPSGLAGLGAYQAAVSWRDIVLFVPGSLGRITVPLLARVRMEEGPSRFASAFRANLSLNVGAAVLVAIPVMVASPWIVQLYGPGFREDWDLIVILLVAAMIQAARDVMLRLTASAGRIWYNTMAATVWSASVLIGVALTVPRWGVRGFAWTWVVAMLISALVYSVAARSILLPGIDRRIQASVGS